MLLTSERENNRILKYWVFQWREI